MKTQKRDRSTSANPIQRLKREDSSFKVEEGMRPSYSDDEKSKEKQSPRGGVGFFEGQPRPPQSDNAKTHNAQASLEMG